MPSKKPSAKPVTLALQGGGAHGAFTWGVLDELLSDGRMEVEAITGTSAGAMNAVIMAYGLQQGGPKEARQLLQRFWNNISAAASLLPFQPTYWDKVMGNHSMDMSPAFMAMDFMTRLFSPYQYNVFDINPLRNILDELVDFEQLRKNKDIKLFINATNVKTGKVRVFRTQEITLDVVMASACLPFLYKAVEIGGEYYWDGGYSGNPALYPLFYDCASSDVIIVQINPIEITTLPTDANQILDRVNEISFNTNLMAEIRAIHFVKKLLEKNAVPQSQYKDMRIHRIAADSVMADYGYASKMNAASGFLSSLRGVGMQAAQEWLDDHFQAVGHHSSIDVEDVYL